MNEPHQPPAPPRWIPGGLAVILVAQLGLLWLQGLQLNRQHHDLMGLRDDLQTLAENLEHSHDALQEEGEAFAPARGARQPRPRYLRVGQQEDKGEAQDPAAKELQAARESAQKAVKEGRKANSQLSITENIKKAEEKAKIKEARSAWETWALVAGAVALGALLLRGWLKAREG